MDWRTASSNSMGPGIRRAGWGAWLDIVVAAGFDRLPSSCRDTAEVDRSRR